MILRICAEWVSAHIFRTIPISSHDMIVPFPLSLGTSEASGAMDATADSARVKRESCRLCERSHQKHKIESLNPSSSLSPEPERRRAARACVLTP